MVAIRGQGAQRTRWEKDATHAVATRGSSRLRPLAPGLGVSLNLPRTHQPAGRGWARGCGWQQCASGVLTPGGASPASSAGPQPRRAAALPDPEGQEEGGGRAAGWGCAGRRSDWLHRRPPPRAACPPPRAQPAPARSPGAGSRWKEDAQGRDWSPRPVPDPERAGIKPGRWRRGAGALLPPVSGEAGPGPIRFPRPRPSDPAPGAGRPARVHATTGTPRRYLQPSNEESPGEPTGAGRDVSCGRGCCCCCRSGGLKLTKVASQREAAARREQKGKELLRCRSDRQRQTDAQTCRRHHVGGLSPEPVRRPSSVHWWEAELVEKAPGRDSEATIMSLRLHTLPTLPGVVRPGCKELLCLLVITVTVSRGASGVCPTACICATDIVSCTNKNLSRVPGNLFRLIKRLDLSYNRIGLLDSEWIPVSLVKLNTLIIRHNNITSISTDSFSTTPNLKCLDLSSNKLKTVKSAVFQELKVLEVLLLYNNHISYLDPSAFGGLSQLQKLYLSGNFLTQFPMDLYVGRFKLAELMFLDVSYNRISSLPMHHINLVPGKQLRGIFLHGNPFVCDCSLYSLLIFWYRRHFSSVMDFKNDYTCRLWSDTRHFHQVLLLQDSFLNCSDSIINGSFRALGFIHEAQVGERLMVHCDGKTGRANTDFMWVGPDNRVLGPDKEMENFHVFPNGSLVIESPRFEDAGVYSCVAMNRQRLLNETVDVTINVSNFTINKSHAHEAFNTAFTTLAACVASIVLVLLYLYLTPCPCKCKPKRRKNMLNQSNVHASILTPCPDSEAPTDERKAGAGKRVVFLEPLKDTATGQNGKVRLFPSETVIAEGILKSTRVKSDSDSVNSVFSDTPFVAST